MPPEPPAPHLREATLNAMQVHLQMAGELLLLSPHAPLQRARLAYRLGEPELAWALIALSGGLFDHAERQRILSEPLPEGLMEQALQRVTVRATRPDWMDSQREMYVRVLAGLLLTGASPTDPALLGASSPDLPAGLWRFPVMPDRTVWQTGLHLIQNLSDLPSTNDIGTRRPSARWACASRGRQWGLRHFLQEHEQAVHIDVVSLEQIMGTLSAAWLWNLPNLPELLARPLILTGLETLSAERFEVLTALLDDCVQLFGWTVMVFPTMERHWPHPYQPYPALGALQAIPTAPGEPEHVAQRHVTEPPAFLSHYQHEQSLADLVSSVSAHSGRSLIVLYSRASAARLAGSLPGSVLLSTSLCRVHLEERMSHLAARQDDPRLTVIATTLPSFPVGLFDRVWHISAPLPFLHEAVQLSRGTFSILRLRDVVVPSAWSERARITEELFEQGDPLNDPSLQQAYFDQLEVHDAWQGGRWRDLRAAGQYASLASELNVQTDNSLPVLIPFNEAAREAIASYRQTGWLPRHDLRFAAWMTPTELQRAIKAGEAIPSGWAAIWQGRYDPVYGLARPYLTFPID